MRVLVRLVGGIAWLLLLLTGCAPERLNLKPNPQPEALNVPPADDERYSKFVVYPNLPTQNPDAPKGGGLDKIPRGPGGPKGIR